ncbi:hypothetical protein LEP1GSC179_2333 [Leptospira santarosai str. MOR084]|uniref:Uncharacterized protein n=1 Tax=Leptospira santarosai str. MOR084 TaxID=1049984 RepID=A0A0E2BIV9_9LEPT|nr:hypothetical protein LEP1GSC179_2333 [Leptospira santarosai str. MOR084]
MNVQINVSYFDLNSIDLNSYLENITKIWGVYKIDFCLVNNRKTEILCRKLNLRRLFLEAGSRVLIFGINSSYCSYGSEW